METKEENKRLSSSSPSVLLLFRFYSWWNKQKLFCGWWVLSALSVLAGSSISQAELPSSSSSSPPLPQAGTKVGGRFVFGVPVAVVRRRMWWVSGRWWWWCLVVGRGQQDPSIARDVQEMGKNVKIDIKSDNSDRSARCRCPWTRSALPGEAISKEHKTWEQAGARNKGSERRMTTQKNNLHVNR